MAERKVKLEAAKKMTISVCRAYIQKKEIEKRFERYDEKREFTTKELQSIVTELIGGKNNKSTDEQEHEQ
ncbi:MAG: hypothetical protein Q4G09_02020 [Clostridia bacterium]|nr:hypothetical protein [Clostridia bacterium]